MNAKQLSDSSFNPIVSVASDASRTDQELSRRGLERSRKTILFGWIISMIGIVTYCFVISGGDQQADLPDALAARGAIGWAAVAVILIGVGLWFIGCVRFLNDADCSPAETANR